MSAVPGERSDPALARLDELVEKINLSHDPAFVDAERIYRTLEAVVRAQNLYQVATERFAAAASIEVVVDGPALAFLVDEDFVRIPTEVANEIDRFQHYEVEGERTRSQLQQAHARLRTAQVQLRRAEADLEKGFFKTRATRWEQESRRDALAKQVEELEFARRRLESDLERAGGLMQRLLERIHRDTQLREAKWFGGRPLCVTHHGHFLLDYLADLNTTHFRGRTLAEIIEVGPSLA